MVRLVITLCDTHSSGYYIKCRVTITVGMITDIAVLYQTVK